MKPPPGVDPAWKSVQKSKSSSSLLQDVKASIRGTSQMSLGMSSVMYMGLGIYFVLKSVSKEHLMCVCSRRGPK